MEQEKAEKAHTLCNEIEYVKNNIKELSKQDCVLCFGTLSDCSDKIYASQQDNRRFKDILDKHHRMIIQELTGDVKKLEQQIIDL